MIDLTKNKRCMNKEFLVCYDIADDKMRNRFFNRMKDLGLFNIQDSVFWGYLNSAEEKAVYRELQKHTADDSDYGFIINVNLSKVITLSTVGYSLDDFPEDIDYGTI